MNKQPWLILHSPLLPSPSPFSHALPPSLPSVLSLSLSLFLSQLPDIKEKMLLSVASRPGISTFGYNKNNKKVGKSAFLEFSYFLFWGSGSALGFNILLKRGTGFLSSLRLSFSTTFFFCHLFLPGSEVPGIYSPLPEA